jgi:hypothetical protein
MSEKFEYYKNILLSVILLAPASRIEKADSVILQLMLPNMNVENLGDEILPENQNLKNISLRFSKYYSTLNHAMIELASDEIPLVNCPERIKVYLSHYPAGTSLRSMLHFKQIAEAKAFQTYNYGDVEENLKRYGEKSPKQYDLSKIEGMNIIICAGKMDKLIHIEDIRWLRDQLKGKNNLKFYEFEYMGHLSFLLSNDITWFNFVLKDLYNILTKL